ncbi:hypothetical protein [Escherichia ruysiae]|uniref:hypothetical protein n=1 Tax=Escherichia ruysiae TaxID=2608867 RepID=UPI001C9AD54E|nr:hypothetical protein [Escherichia ruysiae]MBY7353125.1 hypothetical protein [Escherichia ruysiae]
MRRYKKRRVARLYRLLLQRGGNPDPRFIRDSVSISRFPAHVVGCVDGMSTIQITLPTSRKCGIVSDAFKFNTCPLAALCGRLYFICNKHISFVV